MSDQADLAYETATLLANLAIKQTRSAKPVAVATGYCLYCDKPISETGRRWCDKYCTEDWEHEQKRSHGHG